MTCADYGFIKLLAQKNGWVPKGNTFWGQSHKDGTAWEVGKALTVGSERAYEGYIYKCLIAHTTAVELKPDVSPTYWERGKLIGGISQDNGIDAAHQTGYRTLNGTGPLDWYLGKDPSNLADIIGSSLEQPYGLRYVNCEMQILENNNAADPDADLSASSAAWQAILPNQSDDGYTLVKPGTAGTLHWTWQNSKLTLDTVEPKFDNQYRGTHFKDLAYNATNLPYIPSIVKELGLFPTDSNDNTEGYYYQHMTQDERVLRRGGSFDGASGAGLGCVVSNSPRGDTYPSYGCRPRSLD